MNEILSRVWEEIENQGKKPTEICKEAGISSSTFFTWKTKDKIPPTEPLQRIAECLNVSMDYLVTGKKTAKLNQRDERDIARRLEETLSELEAGQDGLMFSGEPLDDETRELLKISLENSIRLAKVTAKEKFTPKKYRK